MVHRVCFLEGSGPIGDALESEGFASRLGFRRGWGPIGLWRFARTLRAARPKLIHFHWRSLGAMCVARFMFPRTPFIWTEHHPGAVTANLKARVFYRLLKRFFSRFVVTSEAMAKYLQGHGVDPVRVEVIPYALAVPLRRPDPQMPNRGKVVGVLTRLDGPKRIDLFIDVIAELHRRGVSCTGLVVGDGGHKEIYENYAKESALGEVVRFVGMKTDVATWLDRFDVFLTTSSVETFGLAALEAMARGVPVVAMPCPGGLNDLVERGGVLVEDRDPETAAAAVEVLLASAAERIRIGSLGYDVAATYTADASVAKHLNMYRTVLSASGVEQPPIPESG